MLNTGQNPGFEVEGRSGIRIAVLVSGAGSNLEALAEAIVVDPDFGAEIALVVSDRPGLPALERAAAAGLHTVVVPWVEYKDRGTFTEAVCTQAEEHGADALVMAGFMRILGPEAIRMFPGRILNIHPSLLPAFPGENAVAHALSHGVKVTGVTVHFVDEKVDHGPIIAQAVVPVLPGDDEASLHMRIQDEEHRLYPRVVKAFAHGRLKQVGRTVVWT